MNGPDALHAIDQADNALRLSGLGEDDILRKELASARAAFVELIKCAQVSAAALKARGLNDKALRAALAGVGVKP